MNPVSIDARPPIHSAMRNIRFIYVVLAAGLSVAVNLSGCGALSGWAKENPEASRTAADSFRESGRTLGEQAGRAAAGAVPIPGLPQVGAALGEQGGNIIAWLLGLGGAAAGSTVAYRVGNKRGRKAKSAAPATPAAAAVVKSAPDDGVARND